MQSLIGKIVIRGGPDSGKLENGANCQYFAYEFIRHYGRIIPDFRSSDLWKDTIHTKPVKNLNPLDLVLLNKSENAFGAHIGVHLGEELILHLAKDNGFPVIENLKDLLKQTKYGYFIGAKRCL